MYPNNFTVWDPFWVGVGSSCCASYTAGVIRNILYCAVWYVVVDVYILLGNVEMSR